ncbi:uncharacterized protein [Choristoneura fumiferana]|uniref:uncharacterized protein n=1 Tax=Choristoneura fumiferana TaxID=7141 RepID=UPI003D15B629
MSDDTKTPSDVSEENKTDEPTNTKSLNANNDTVIEIEDGVEEQKISEAEQLKQAVFKDQGLHGVYVIAGKGKKCRPKRHEHDGDMYSNRVIWVQAMMSQSSGQEIGEESRGPFIRKVFAILFFCMLFTSTFAAMSFFVPEIRLFFRSPAGLILTVFAM